MYVWASDNSTTDNVYNIYTVCVILLVILILKGQSSTELSHFWNSEAESSVNKLSKL